MSFIAETFIFLYVGMDALDIEKWRMTHLKYDYFLQLGTISFLMTNALDTDLCYVIYGLVHVPVSYVYKLSICIVPMCHLPT